MIDPSRRNQDSIRCFIWSVLWLLLVISLESPARAEQEEAEGPLVQAIEVEGTRRIEPDVIYLRIRTKQGSPLNRKVIRQDIRSIMRQSGCWVFFMGHTHELKLVTVSEDSVEWGELGEGIVMLDRNRRYLVNAGSVGQPRDGDGRAKYVIWDSGLGTIEVRALAYPVEVTAEKIIARGFPKAYALRLK